MIVSKGRVWVASAFCCWPWRGSPRLNFLPIHTCRFPKSPVGPTIERTAGKKSKAYNVEREIVTKIKAANLTKKTTGAKNMKKLAPKVDKEEERTEMPMASKV